MSDTKLVYQYDSTTCDGPEAGPQQHPATDGTGYVQGGGTVGEHRGMSLSVRSGEGLWHRAGVPLSATSGQKLRCVAPPQRIHTRPPETRGTDETSTSATIGSRRYHVTCHTR